MELEKNVRLDSSKLNVKAKQNYGGSVLMVMNGLQDWTIVKEVPVVHMIQVNGSCLVIALQILFPKFEQ